MVLSVTHVSFSYGIDEILEDVHFQIEENDKVAIVGVNGAGKTTLLKLISGELTPEKGNIYIEKGKSIGYLAQMLELDEKGTIESEFFQVFASLILQEEQLRQKEQDMTLLKGTALEEAMNEYAILMEDFEKNQGYQYENKVKGMINHLGLLDIKDQPIAQFSGGQKSRISLGKLLLSEPDILLLDEPTNHLDMEHIEWLEETFIKNYPGTVILVSHDRYFVNKTTDAIIEIEHGMSTLFKGSYDTYAKQKEIEREILLSHYMNQQKEIRRQEDMIRTYYARATEKQIKIAKSKQKRLDKVKRLERPDNSPHGIKIAIQPHKRSGENVLIMENVSKSFGAFMLFDHVTLHIRRGDKVALIGDNGVGKTTLFQIIQGQRDGVKGRVELGTHVDIGYFDQEFKIFNENNTIYDELLYAYTDRSPYEIRSALAAFGFTGDDVFKEISHLSGGEKGRVGLCKLVLSDANFLLLDEPTNHLDMQSQEILGEALKDYEGTILFISHDRYFINQVADMVIELTPQRSTLFLGDYEYYMDKKKNVVSRPVISQNATGKNEWAEQKRIESEIRKLDTMLEKLEMDISTLEDEIEALDIQLHQEEIYSDPKKVYTMASQKESKEKELASLFLQWEDISTQIENRQEE